MANRTIALVIAAGLAAAACTSPAEDPASPATEPAGPSIDNALSLDGLEFRPGPFQLTIDEIPPTIAPGAVVEVGSGSGAVTRAEIADNGSAVIRGLEAGPATLRVIVEDPADPNGARSSPDLAVTVAGTEPPADLYRRAVLEPGFGYIETRDGTTLSALVTLPGPATDGPYPTLIEYSGYEPSRPGGTDAARLIVPSLGYALVQVNVRGTGCSGGSFDAFESIQALDGYDVVETVANQDWAAKVGMFGVSYAAIMQLHVAATRPPSLDAIAPMSVLDRIDSVLYPGGIYNNGFAESWTRRVGDRATAFGQGWEQARVDGGDVECGRNQRLRRHNPDLIEVARSSPFDTELLADRSPLATASRIEVPVFLAGAWQDEQTGPGWPALIDALSNAPVVRVMAYNGLHIDAISPEVLDEVTAFYDLYLDDPDPGAGPGLRLALSLGLAAVFGEVLPVSFSPVGDDRDEARRLYEADDPIKVGFDLGADRPNLPVAGFELSFDSWPPAEMAPVPYALSPGSGGRPTLVRGQPTGSVEATFSTTPGEGALTTSDDLEQLWTSRPGWRWPRSASAVVASTEPLGADLVLVGPASADLWLSADAPDADIEVNLSEIAPDGSETYVQSGWLRVSQRALAADATVLEPTRSGSEADVSLLRPGGEPVLARVEIPPFAHAFRSGSRLALTIDTPGASQPQWSFDVLPDVTAVTIHSDPSRPSQLVLPVIADAVVPTPRPPCGSLRGQPCRLG